MAYTPPLPPALLAAARAHHVAIDGVPGLTVDRDALAAGPELQSTAALALVCDVFEEVRPLLEAVLARRVRDRAFLDEVTRAAVAHNRGLDYLDPAYRTPIGARDASGRVVCGPLPTPAASPRVSLPPHLAGPSVTLFGPPDSAKMCINAMNAWHRRRADEPALVTALVEGSELLPRWGADSEDSKTPFVADLVAATDNLRRCYDGSLAFTDPDTGREYRIAGDRRALPIKRVPGLALPDAAHQLRGEPLPLHLVDLVLHAFHNRHRPEALVFYVPKLEDEAEAAYVGALIAAVERRLIALDPSYAPGTIRVFVVFETARAIFRIREMADALHPHFAGGSLGWHDFLAFVARLFRHDPRFRIPVKADPNIVIRHIRESHRVLAEAMRTIGGVAIGGMYGTLFTEGDPRSFQVSMVGYVKDVVTQLRRGLDGFWVAHPDFVRVGIAIVEAWRRGAADPADGTLDALVAALVPDPDELAALRAFLGRPDADGLTRDDPTWPRALLAATIERSEVIANDDPEEVRYNVFQALQYLASWLAGEGCVALPATMRTAAGEPVFVRVMDDLATTERSRWELWHEVHHGRVPLAVFDAILAEELDFLRAGRATPTKRVQVVWAGEAARWYPIAAALLRQLVTAEDPPESVSELLLPFTLRPVREAVDPLAAARELCPGRYGPG